VSVLVIGLAPGATAADRLGILGLIAVPATVLVWMSLRIRTVIEPGGLRLYSMVRTRYVSWDALEAVALRRFGPFRQDCVVLTVDGKDFATPVPIDRTRYTSEAVEDIEAAWRAATGRG
jgi:hypothetical protein